VAVVLLALTDLLFLTAVMVPQVLMVTLQKVVKAAVEVVPVYFLMVQEAMVVLEVVMEVVAVAVVLGLLEQLALAATVGLVAVDMR
jgi:hypothetical protein